MKYISTIIIFVAIVIATAMIYEFEKLMAKPIQGPYIPVNLSKI
jgi:hypothetical protein